MKRLVLPLLALSLLAGCVSTGKYKAEQSAAATQKDRADALDAQFAALKSSDTAIQGDLSARLKATSDTLASAQVSNADLEQSLAANKSTLSKKVAELIKDRDALAQKSDGQAAQIAALEKKAADADAAAAAAEAAKAADLAKAQKSYDDLAAGLKSEIAAGDIKITQLQGKLTVNLVDRILFDSGKAEIKADGRKVLDKVGGILNTVVDKNIRIEGYTDDKPIAGELLAKYPSNWELSTARATAVVRYLQDHDKVDPARLVAAGYGENHPVATNGTPEGRALNRRIEIVLVPRD
ncbi:MAG TPA: OmpA family protein [Elusimicrobiota bacterium]|jgi:chemotaxis protein MotB|nr:OmpA family protein [Elusimicrobiota bacterium]